MLHKRKTALISNGSILNKLQLLQQLPCDYPCQQHPICCHAWPNLKGCGVTAPFACHAADSRVLLLPYFADDSTESVSVLSNRSSQRTSGTELSPKCEGMIVHLLWHCQFCSTFLFLFFRASQRGDSIAVPVACPLLFAKVFLLHQACSLVPVAAATVGLCTDSPVNAFWPACIIWSSSSQLSTLHF